MKIAVFLDDNKGILPFYESGIVEVYSDDQSGWVCVDQIPLDMTLQRDLSDIQWRVKMLVSEFDDCNLLIVESIKGLPMAILQEFGVGVWKAGGKFSEAILDFVKSKLADAIQKAEEDKRPIRPAQVGETNEAEYAIDLIPLLTGDRRLNSIDILVPFIKETNFRKLQIICSHVPKWFNRAISEFRLTSSIKELEPDVLQVTVSPIQWIDDISFRQSIYIPGVGGGCSC